MRKHSSQIIILFSLSFLIFSTSTPSTTTTLKELKSTKTLQTLYLSNQTQLENRPALYSSTVSDISMGTKHRVGLCFEIIQNLPIPPQKKKNNNSADVCGARCANECLYSARIILPAIKPYLKLVTFRYI